MRVCFFVCLFFCLWLPQHESIIGLLEGKKKKSENVVSFSSLTLLIFFFLLNTKAICYSHH